jgi:hypothetical protein
MYGVVTRVTVNDGESATQNLRENIIPRVKEAQGFKNGYWLRKDNSGMSVVLCESEEDARALAEQMRSANFVGVELEGIEVREVVADA